MEAAGPRQEVARRFRVSRPTVGCGCVATRKRERPGLRTGLSGPRRRPGAAPPALERRICSVRRRQGFGPAPHRLGAGGRLLLGLRVLRRFGLNRRPPASRRPERACATNTRSPVTWARCRLDVKKLARIPDGGGHRGSRTLQRDPTRTRTASTTCSRRRRPQPLRRTSRPCPTSAGATCAAFLERALAHFRTRGVAVRRVRHRRPGTTPSPVSSSRSPMPTASRSSSPAPTARRPTGRRSASSRPLNEWASLARTAPTPGLHQLPRWLYRYNARRPHGSIGGVAPASRL